MYTETSLKSWGFKKKRQFFLISKLFGFGLIEGPDLSTLNLSLNSGEEKRPWKALTNTLANIVHTHNPVVSRLPPRGQTVNP